MENEHVTKEELKRTILIDKLEQTVQKQDIKIEQLEKENESLKLKVAELETECHDTLTQCQQHVNDVEDRNDDLEAEIEGFKSKVLSDEELLFYYGCRGDMVLNEAYENNMTILSNDYLIADKFPNALLNKLIEKSDSISTTNFTIVKINNNKYELIKN